MSKVMLYLINVRVVMVMVELHVLGFYLNM